MADETTHDNPGDDAATNTPAEAALDQAQRAADELSAETGAETSPGAFELPDIDDGAAAEDEESAVSLALLNDVALNVKIELGRTRMYVEDVLRLNAESVIELDKAAGDPVDIFVNERLVARGEVLVLNENFCVRVSDIVDQLDADL